MDVKKTTWIKNFSINRVGYLLVESVWSREWPISQKATFGKEKPLILQNGIVLDYKGVDCLGAYLPEPELAQLIDTTIKLIFEKPEQVLALHKTIYDDLDKVFAFVKNALAKDHAKLSDKELEEIFNEFMEHKVNIHHKPLVTTWFLDSYGERFSKRLLEETKKFVTKTGSEKDFAEAFSLLTTKPANSMQFEEELDALRVLKLIVGNKESRDAILKLTDFSRIPEAVPDKIKDTMTAHCEKWCWTPFGYMDTPYDMSYYLERWKTRLEQEIDVDAAIAELEGRPARVQRERTGLAKELGVDQHTMQIYDIAADIAYLKGYRKDALYYMCYLLDKIYAQALPRAGLQKEDEHLMILSELETLFAGKDVPSAAELKRREGRTVLVGDENGQMTFLYDEDAAAYMDALPIIKEDVDAAANQLHGTCACSGSAKGTVKIINAVSDMPKMNQGDILVSHTTFPSLVPAMEKAAAIISEDGGITCHAAIVSRELGTPCVTGVKTALKVLKDGDVVEVRASEGRIIIER